MLWLAHTYARPALINRQTHARLASAVAQLAWEPQIMFNAPQAYQGIEAGRLELIRRRRAFAPTLYYD